MVEQPIRNRQVASSTLALGSNSIGARDELALQLSKRTSRRAVAEQLATFASPWPRRNEVVSGTIAQAELSMYALRHAS